MHTGSFRVVLRFSPTITVGLSVNGKFSLKIPRYNLAALHLQIFYVHNRMLQLGCPQSLL
jgi:hypothetical protein